ncbi:MAG: adenosine deaminase [Acidobacteriota bacterium]
MELHLHLEGSISESFKDRLAGRRPHARGRGRKAPLICQGFDSFLHAFRDVCQLLRSEDDLRRVVRELGRRLRRERVRHAEVYFSPQVHVHNGFSYERIFASLANGCEEVRAMGGPSLYLIADGVRQWGPEAFEGMVDHLLAHASWPVVAVGLGGDENSYPARPFSRAFQRAREGGLAAVVHAGEIGSASAVAGVLECLNPVRIAHGIRAVDDPELLGQLAMLRIPLDVCLTSNCRTGAVLSLAEHPLPRLLKAGVLVSLGTDDPALFRTTLSLEYVRAASLGLDRATLGGLACQAAAGSLLPQAGRRKLARQIHRAWETWSLASATGAAENSNPLKNEDRTRLGE